MEISKYLKPLLLIAFAWGSVWTGAETIAIGTGEVLNQGLPLEPFARYTYSQQLFTASEISAAGSITQVQFQYHVASTYFYEGCRQLKLWLGHSDRSVMTGWIPVDSLILVYDGMLMASDFSAGLPGDGWLTVNLAWPFVYNGTQNLVLAADENSYENGSTADDFYCTGCTQQLSVQFQSQSVNPDPYAPPGTGYTLKAYRSNLRLEMDAVHYTPVQPSPAHSAMQVPIDTDFNWISDCESYDLKLGTHPDSLITVANNLPGCQWQAEAPLQYSRQYFWQVLGYYGGNTYPSPLWQFTTASESISPPRNLSAVYHSPVVQLSWQAPDSGTAHFYRIFRNSSLVQTVSGTAYNDQTIQPGQSYIYYVTAISATGNESSPSNLASVSIPNVPNALLEQGFEACEAFSGDFPGWQALDLDQSLSWSWYGLEFPHNGSAFSWLCFAPGQTIPPLNGFPPASGTKMAMAMSALSPPNNDWLISPSLHLGNQAALTFKARSTTADYGLERLRLLISTTTDDPGAFIPLSGGAYIEVPVNWMEFSYDLTAYHNQNIYLAWQCVSWDAFALFLDDIVLVSEGGHVPNDDAAVPPARTACYPNPSRGYFQLRTPTKAPLDIQIYDLKGRLVYQANHLQAFDSSLLSRPLCSGIYFIRITQGGDSQLIKQVVIK